MVKIPWYDVTTTTLRKTVRQLPRGSVRGTGRPGLRGLFGVYGLVRFSREIICTKPPHFAQRFGVYEKSGKTQIRVALEPRPACPGFCGPQGSGVEFRRGPLCSPGETVVINIVSGRLCGHDLSLVLGSLGGVILSSMVLLGLFSG